jgi:hypothetical protein
MKHLKPSAIEYKNVMENVYKSVHKNEGAKYIEEFNPYTKETTNFGRFERQYPKVRKSYFDFISIMKDMEEIYGPIKE